MALVGVLSACGQASGPTVATEAPRPPVTVAQVKEGDISAVLSLSGNIVAPSQVSIMPKITGQIVKLNVDIGSKVKQGDLIAELDHVALDAQLEQAQANLDKERAQGRTENVAAAQAQAAAAQAKLQDMLSGRPEDVATAQATLDAARAKLRDLQNQGRPEDIQAAQAVLQQQQAKLDTMLKGSRPEDIATAQANVDTNKQKLAQLLSGPTPQQVAQAKAAIDSAKAGLYQAQANRDATRPKGLTPDQGNSMVAVAQATVVAAQAAFDVTVQPPTPQAVQQQRDALSQAQDALNKALMPFRPEEIEQQRQAVAQAQQQLDKARTPNTPEVIEQQRQVVAQAEQALAKARVPNTPAAIEQQRQVVAQAEQQVALAVTPFTPEDIAVAQAAVDVAKAQRDQAFITAPFAGTISDRALSVGATANPNQPIVSMIGNDIEIQLTVAEAQLPQLSVGQPVQITTAAYPDQTFNGKVTVVAPSADPKSRTFLVKVAPEDPNGKLKPGMLAKVSVTTAVHKGVPLVPKEALVDKGGKTGVFTVVGSGADTVVHFQPVTTGLSDDKQVEVNQGVKVDDQVVVSGQAYLNDNDKVRVNTSQ